MTIQEKDITVFFFGSPANGFSSFPKNYVGLVKSLDLARAKQNITCTYEIIENKSVVKYIIYNLTGVGVKGNNSSRGGRNFGVWIEFTGYQLNEQGKDEIVDYIDNWIQKGIVQNAQIFKDNKPLHYIVYSFSEVEDKLESLRNGIIQNLIKNFSSNIISIIDNDRIQFNLIPIQEDKTIDNNNEIINTHNINESNQIQIKGTEKNKEDYNRINKGIIYKVLLGVLVVLNLLIFFKIGNLNKENTQVLDEIPIEISNLTASDIKQLTAQQISHLDSSQINSLTKKQIQQLINQQIKYLTSKQTENIADNQILNLMANYIKNLDEEKIKKIQEMIGFTEDDVDGNWGDGSMVKFKDFMK